MAKDVVREAVEWVGEVIGDVGIGGDLADYRDRAPSGSAWSMLCWAASDRSSMTAFWRLWSSVMGSGSGKRGSVPGGFGDAGELERRFGGASRDV